MLDFQFHTPPTLHEALALLDEHGEDARLFAGGTALVVLMKQSLVVADHMVSLQRVPDMDRIHLEDDGLHIGALTRHREVETSELVREHAPLLADVLRARRRRPASATSPPWAAAWRTPTRLRTHRPA